MLPKKNLSDVVDAVNYALKKMMEAEEDKKSRANKNGVEYAIWRLKRKEKKNANR